MKWARRTIIILALVFMGPVIMVSCGNVKLGQDWRTADRGSTGIAPNPLATEEAVVQAYAARAFNWRGIFAVHTWIAVKPRGAASYTVYQVLGWRAYRNQPVVTRYNDLPDRSWYGAAPELLMDLRGEEAETVIPLIADAVDSYPYTHDYGLWPGPNSNTFIAWVARRVPTLGLELPATAIGKDFLGNGDVVGPAPSGTGYQLSLHGVLGVLAAEREGLEFNILGLNFGIDPLGPAIKLPGVGRLGFDRRS